MRKHRQFTNEFKLEAVKLAERTLASPEAGRQPMPHRSACWGKLSCVGASRMRLCQASMPKLDLALWGLASSESRSVGWAAGWTDQRSVPQPAELHSVRAALLRRGGDGNAGSPLATCP